VLSATMVVKEVGNYLSAAIVADAKPYYYYDFHIFTKA
jgi:hypothetical protein